MQAILLLAHKGKEYIENFLKQFDERFNVYIHVDIKNKLNDEDISYLKDRFKFIKSIDSIYDCQYSRISIIDAELFLIKQALKDTSNKYIHLMSEQCYICHDLNYFFNFFEDNNTEYIWIEDMYGTFDCVGCSNIWRVINNKYHYYGGQWFSLTYSLLNDILNNEHIDQYYKEIKEYSDNPDNDSHRQAVDEAFLQNFIMEFGYYDNKKYNFNKTDYDSSLRFVDWLARGVNSDKTHPSVLLSNRYYSKIQLKRATNNFYLIVRKIDFKNKYSIEQLNNIKRIYNINDKMENYKIKETPLVSVCMCTRNRAIRMLPSIKCILDQTYKNFEFIIINDASTDNTEEILNDIEQTDNRVRHVTLKNHDFIEARNTAFREAKGKYICLIDSDDKCSPNKIEEQVKILENNNNIDVIGCKIKFGKKTSHFSIPNSHFNWDNDFFKSQLTEKNENISMLLHFPSIMIRHDILDKVFSNKIYFYPELKNGGEDQIFLYTLYINGAKFGNINTAVYLYNYLEYDDAISASIGKHFDNDNFIFKFIHNKPFADKIKIVSDLYNKYIKHVI